MGWVWPRMENVRSVLELYCHYYLVVGEGGVREGVV